ncbi:MAG: ankyrin repeat domain-containing protein [Elusimicrobiota bacterium]|jgi:ankyrin repeat protein|nr:ankyrin repeat domain-containing protein [Elusimicrobiota bacterium]
MKKILPAAITLCLAFAACGKKAPEADFWHTSPDFIKAVELAAPEAVEGLLLTTQTDFNAPDEFGRTALIFAVETTANPDVITKLAESDKVNLALKDNDGNDAMAVALKTNNNPEVIKRLLIAGAPLTNPAALQAAAQENPNPNIDKVLAAALNKAPWHQDKAFTDALVNADFDAVKAMLPFIDVTAAGSGGANAVLTQLTKANARVLDLLIKAGAPVNQATDKNITPLLYAATNIQDPQITQTLITAGADVNQVLPWGSTLLYDMIKHNPNRAQLLKILTQAGANAAVVDGQGTPLIHFAVHTFTGNAPLLKNIIDAGVAADSLDKAGYTPLIIAAMQSPNPQVIEILAAAGANVNYKMPPPTEFTPLTAAAAHNANADITDALIKAGADVNLPGVSKMPPLTAAAAYNENEQVAQKLINAGAKLDEPYQPGGSTPAMTAAAANKNEKVLIAIVNAGADISDYQKLLAHGRQNPNKEVIVPLIQTLEREPDVQASIQTNSTSPKAWYNNSAYEKAVEAKDAKALRLAIGGGVNVKVMYIGQRRVSALMQAIADTDNEQIADVLIKAGVDVNAKNENNDTALLVAALISNNPKLIETLIKAGADIDAVDNTGVTPVIAAAANNTNPQILQTLLAAGAKTGDIGLLLEHAQKNKNPQIRDIVLGIK